MHDRSATSTMSVKQKNEKNILTIYKSLVPAKLFWKMFTNCVHIKHFTDVSTFSSNKRFLLTGGSLRFNLIDNHFSGSIIKNHSLI